MITSFFSSPSEFRDWLIENHEKEKEPLVRYYKLNTGKPSMTWSESVDEALCFGWIDSVRRSIDAESYSIRFTPRKPKSIWSAVNLKKWRNSLLMAKCKKLGYIFLTCAMKVSKIFILSRDQLLYFL